MNIISTTVGKESLRRNGVALIVNKRPISLKNHRLILVCFQGKPFNITEIQVYGQSVMLKKVQDLQDFL